ncbi:response regulator [Phenylobacterium terrae]|uniref:Response regulator n=1 Tax=Phenylobacterium terrae TaxID=2665495 RepID=A0ABW4N8R1_9CAUL
MLKVLILQDDPIAAVLLQEAIEAAGHAVAGWAMNAEDAVALTATHRPDLLIIDTDLDAFDASTESVLEIGRKADAQIVFLTNGDERVREALATLQPVAILDLPWREESLRTALDRADSARPSQV